mmetsp:Transcript_23724/g.58153  ORF Transcript_23724/g.58153 Transcript_23724/m.58153 type:complete len:226 (+) Transcript_23724:72-749(+)
MAPKELSKETSETQATISEDDDAKYGYNTYSDEEQRRPWSPQALSPSGSSVNSATDGNSNNHRRRMPCRSSLKGGSGTPRQFRRNSLTFVSNVAVTPIIPTPELAKKKSLWFDDEDYDKIQKKILLIVERAQGGEGHKHCTRGLENIIQRGTESRRYAAWDAVLHEQQNQIRAGAEVFDDHALSRSYQEACKDSHAEANARAIQDEKAVSKYLSETKFYCRRMSM